jgi:hypothetical protein
MPSRRKTRRRKPPTLPPARPIRPPYRQPATSHRDRRESREPPYQATTRPQAAILPRQLQLQPPRTPNRPPRPLQPPRPPRIALTPYLPPARGNTPYLILDGVSPSFDLCGDLDDDDIDEPVTAVPKDRRLPAPPLRRTASTTTSSASPAASSAPPKTLTLAPICHRLRPQVLYGRLFFLHYFSSPFNLLNGSIFFLRKSRCRRTSR